MMYGVHFEAMKPGKKHFAGGWFMVLGVVIFGFVVLQLTQGSILPESLSGTLARPAIAAGSAPAITFVGADDLLARCGRPDRDFDTGGFEPAPIIPERVLTYRKAHLKIAYIADDPRGLDPPYHYRWTLMGLVDTQTNRVIELSAFRSTLQTRLHCTLN